MEQELAVSFRSKDGGVDYVYARCAKGYDGGSHLLNRCRLSTLVPHNATFSNQFPADFELRFDENDDAASSSILGKGGVDYSWKHQSGGNERNIHGDEVHEPAQGIANMVR